MFPLHFRKADHVTATTARKLPPKTSQIDTPQEQAPHGDVYETMAQTQSEWKPGIGKPATKASTPILKRLRQTGIRYALQVAMTVSSVGPMLNPFSSSAQESAPETRIEQTLSPQELQNVQDISAYHVSERDFVAQPIDSVKQKAIQALNEKVGDSTEVIGQNDDKPTLLGYELDTKFAKVSASPSFKDGELKAKIKASAVKFSAHKEWTQENGTLVRQGLSTRVRYEGEATYSKDGGFGFQSNNLDAELGLEQRYDKTIGNDVHFAHRYFAGARYRYRFGEQKGSEVRALIQTEQSAYKNDAFQVLGQDFGWEARAKQTFETNWGKVDGNGGQGIFEVQGLVTKKVNVKLLGKNREFRVKAGPELQYSTRNGFSVRPEVGVKVKL